MSRPRRGKVLCVGRVYCDLIFSGVPKIPDPGEEVYAGHFSAHAGGGAYITAAYLAAAGFETGLCAVLPSGPFGQIVADELGQAGLDLDFCQRASPGAEPQVTVAMALAQDRAFLTRRSGASVPDTIDDALADPRLTHLHIAELATLLDNPGLVAVAASRELTISLDCAWDEAALAQADPQSLLNGVDLFLPNERELRALVRLEGSLEDGATEISGVAPIVAIKRGGAGATLVSGSRILEVPALPSSVVDTTGAGDAFNAGFIAAWLNGQDVAACLAGGNRLGAEAVGFIGGASAAGSPPVSRQVSR